MPTFTCISLSEISNCRSSVCVGGSVYVGLNTKWEKIILILLSNDDLRCR